MHWSCDYNRKRSLHNHQTQWSFLRSELSSLLWAKHFMESSAQAVNFPRTIKILPIPDSKFQTYQIILSTHSNMTRERKVSNQCHPCLTLIFLPIPTGDGMFRSYHAVMVSLDNKSPVSQWAIRDQEGVWVMEVLKGSRIGSVCVN